MGRDGGTQGSVYRSGEGGWRRRGKQKECRWGRAAERMQGLWLLFFLSEEIGEGKGYEVEEAGSRAVGMEGG